MTARLKMRRHHGMFQLGSNRFSDILTIASLPSILGFDNGNFSTKMGIAFRNSASRMVISRVEFSGPAEHPHRPRTAASLYDHSSHIGVNENGEVFVGKEALYQDLNFSMKSAEIYCASRGSRKVAKRLEDGRDLLEAIDRHLLTFDIIESTLRRYHDLMRVLALQHAGNHGKDVEVVVRTYPSFLHYDEDPELFGVYIDYCIKRTRDAWGVKCASISEGQAIARFVCAKFRDPVSGSNRKYVYDLFRDHIKNREIVLEIDDIGSCGLVCSSPHCHSPNESQRNSLFLTTSLCQNSELVLVCFDTHGNVESHESIVIDGFRYGM